MCSLQGVSHPPPHLSRYGPLGILASTVVGWGAPGGFQQGGGELGVRGMGEEQAWGSGWGWSVLAAANNPHIRPSTPSLTANLTLGHERLHPLRLFPLVPPRGELGAL